MASAEIRSEEDPKVNLAPLGEMVSVQKALKRLIEQKKPLGREVVLGVLRSEQEAYTLAKRFGDKASDLGKITKGFEEGLIEVNDLLRAAGMSATETKTNSGGFKGFLRRFRP